MFSDTSENNAQHLSSSNAHLMSFGLLLIIYLLACSSLGGLYFSVALDNIEMMLIQTLLVLRAGVQSLSKVLKQIYPHA